MIILGFILLALAVAAAIVLIAQNPDAMMSFHALGNSYNVHAYWVFVGGMVVVAVAAIGLSIMRAGAAHGARVRRERRDLAAENARLSERVVETNDGERVAETSGSRHAWGRRSHRTV
jgi:hypothetical protein